MEKSVLLSAEVEQFRFYPGRRYEKERPWLSSLLDAYALVDYSVDVAIAESNQALACTQGCFACCSQPVPLTLLEAQGIHFFLRHMASEALLMHIRMVWKKTVACLFLDNGGCGLYSFRPIACRRYLVANKQCLAMEDPTVTRPGEMIIPKREYLLAALRKTAPYYTQAGFLFGGKPTLEDFAKVTTLIQNIGWEEYFLSPA